MCQLPPLTCSQAFPDLEQKDKQTNRHDNCKVTIGTAERAVYARLVKDLRMKQLLSRQNGSR